MRNLLLVLMPPPPQQISIILPVNHSLGTAVPADNAGLQVSETVRKTKYAASTVWSAANADASGTALLTTANKSAHRTFLSRRGPRADLADQKRFAPTQMSSQSHRRNAVTRLRHQFPQRHYAVDRHPQRQRVHVTAIAEATVTPARRRTRLSASAMCQCFTNSAARRFRK